MLQTELTETVCKCDNVTELEELSFGNEIMLQVGLLVASLGTGLHYTFQRNF